MEQYTPMIRQYLEIKADYPDAFLFFRLGDFYELFFEDAIKASRELEITLTGRDGGSAERIPMCGVPYHSVEGYIKTLIQKGYKVAICEQVEDPKEAKGVVKREVTRMITPGTVMEGSMLSPENNYLGVLLKEQGVYGLAFSDLTTGEFYAYSDSLDTWIATLEEILPFAPKELIIPQNIEEEEFNQLRSYLSSTFTYLDTDHELNKWEEMVINWFPKQGNQLSTLSKMASGALLCYLQKTQKRAVDHIRELQVIESKRHLILDPFTRRNLEITETIRSKSKYGSLLWLMDKTVTPMGSRLLKRWMDKPLLQAQHIEERLDGVQFFVEEPIIREELRLLMKEVYDLERLVGRISYGNLNGRDLAQLRRTLTIVPRLLDPFSDGNTMLNSHLDVLEGERQRNLPGMIRFLENMDLCSDICGKLTDAIVEDPPVAIKEGGLIKDGYDPHLDRLREASREGKRWIAGLEQQEREVTGIRSLKIGYNKVFGYYIEVTKANLAALPEGRYERKQTLTNAERFVTQELKEKEALILEAEESMSELEYRLFLELRDYLAGQIPRLQLLAKQLASIDVLATLAEIATQYRYTRPRINPKENIYIKDGRHPVIEAVLQGKRYIPNSTQMDQENRIYLITGPNMAGKSTYMRQVALISIMFQMGSFVPAEEAELPIVDRIFTRIGAADDLVEGESTFMVEMNEIKVTTTQATPKSLVIIDELGRGTSTQDGMAIAQAVIEHLHNHIGCKTLVSTHFHELATLESRLKGLKNYHMAVKETTDNVVFTRQLISGAASKSYGIYCAHLAGIPESIIQRANQLISHVGNEAPEQLELTLSTSTIEEPQSIYPRGEEVLEEIKALDLFNLTPLQAMNILNELKRKLQD